ncbi:MAG: replicative DNA helicase, partial [Nevskiales bacterium]
MAVTALKLPPHSVEAEQSVLGGLMLDNEAWETVVGLVNDEDFYRADHRLIYHALEALADANHPRDVVTVSEWLKGKGQLEEAGGLAYLGQLAKDTPSAANIKAYANIVREKAVMRALIRVGTEITNLGFETEGRGSSELVETAEQRVFEIADRRRKSASFFEPISHLLTGAINHIQKLFESKTGITGLATGLLDFDKLTCGLQNGDLVIIAGRPSMGKTSFAMNLVEHICVRDKLPTAIFSMEMSGEQVALRMISSLGRIDQQRLRSGQLQDQDWPRVTSTVALMAEAPLYVDDTGALSPAEVRARARR